MGQFFEGCKVLGSHYTAHLVDPGIGIGINQRDQLPEALSKELAI